MADALRRTPVGVVPFVVRAAVVVTAALLLTSLGGAAIYAAPVTLPALLGISAFSPERSWRYTAAIVAGLTALEVAWAAAWSLAGHGLLSIAAGLITGVVVALVFAHTGSHRTQAAAASTG